MPPHRTRRRIPEATVARLPVYLQILVEQSEGGVDSVSSEGLAELAGVNAAKVRKDLSYLGSYGTRGVGYEVEYLVFQIRRELGLDHEWPVVIVGAGNLGQALAGYGGFNGRGFPVAGMVDIDPEKVDTVVAGVRVRPLDELSRIVGAGGISIGVIATPAGAAQDAADRLISAGVTSILNFAPVVLSVPSTISVRKVDLAVELQILTYHEQRKANAAPRRSDTSTADGPSGSGNAGSNSSGSNSSGSNSSGSNSSGSNGSGLKGSAAHSSGLNNSASNSSGGARLHPFADRQRGATA